MVNLPLLARRMALGWAEEELCVAHEVGPETLREVMRGDMFQALYREEVTKIYLGERGADGGV